MVEIRQDLQGKSVLVTGGTGFIGSKLVEALLDYEAWVTVLVDDETKLSRIKSLRENPRLRLVFCSLTDVDNLAARRQELGDVDLVAHLGLLVPQATTFHEQAVMEITMNLLPTLNLLEAVGDMVTGICFASSIAVYGRPTRLPLREDDPPCPVSSYGVTKLAIENYLRAYGMSKQIPVTVLRYSTVYGPGELGHRAIPNFIRALSEGQPPLINGDGAEKRDYVYIDDVVRATIQALIKKPSCVLNIGSGQSHSTLQIAREMIRICSVDVEPVFVTRQEPNMDVICDISAAGDVLGYFPYTSLEQGLWQEIEWYERKVLGRPLILSANRGK